MSSQQSLEGKACLVTGATGGIGFASVIALLAAGARGVTLVDISKSALDKAWTSLLSMPDLVAEGDIFERVHTIAADVSSAEQVERYTREAAMRWGGRLDVVFLNAGVLGKFGPIEAREQSEFDFVMGVNGRGTWLGCKYASPHLEKGGSVIITSSISALGGYPDNTPYSMSKWAIRGLSRCLAKEWGPRGIRVNAICPGTIETPFLDIARPDERELGAARTPLGRVGLPTEIAKVVVFLASDDSSYMSGGEVTVDGAMTA